MIQPDEDMEKYLGRFRRRSSPQGLKERILEGCRRRAGDDAGPLMTWRHWVLLAAEGLALLLLLVLAPGKMATGKYANIFVPREAAETGARLFSEVANLGEEAAGLSAAERAGIGRWLVLGQPGEPRRPRPSTWNDWED
jgi:hypothetical protein